ncbi:MAG: D-aminoacylase [Gemmatimonadota bacterium]|nr:D-aminoacylase [Gemmatimonadota bacterium]
MLKRLILLLVLAGTACGPSDRLDFILENGWVVDGTGNPRFRADVGVRGDRIAAIGHLTDVPARRRVDVSELVVAPGFIDMLGWSDIKLLADGRAVSKITQGITTEITGEGTSVAPHSPATIEEDADYYARLGVVVDWKDLDGYFTRFERSGSAINLASFVGATQVRKVVLGDADRAPTPDELAHMVALVDSAMLQGALGVSTSLVYAPAFYASTDELVALAQAAQRHGGVYATHLRNEGAGMDAALDEALAIAQAADIPVEIWHLKRAGEANWGDMARMLARLDSARAAGIDITADLYPYQAGAASLGASIPQWAHEGGTDSLITRLRDPAARDRIRAEITGPSMGIQNFYRDAGGANGVLVAGVFADSLKYLEGKSIRQVASIWGVSPEDALFDMLIKDAANTGAIYFMMQESDVREAIRAPWTSFCTDYGAVAPDGILSTDQVHPRVYGSFPRVLGRYVREHQLLTLELAVRKMTSLAAQRVGLFDRGLLRPGLAADIVVFDAESIIDRATFEDPHRVSDGMRYVLVNGVMVLDDARVTDARPGRGLRGPGWTSRN